MLPNDPLVAALTPTQIDFITWNLLQESEEVRKALSRGPGGREITGAQDAGPLIAAAAGAD